MQPGAPEADDSEVDLSLLCTGFAGACWPLLGAAPAWKFPATRQAAGAVDGTNAAELGV